MSFYDVISGNFGASMLGALAGAGAAFAMQMVDRQQQQDQADHMAVLKAQMALIGMLNSLRNLEDQYLAPYRAPELVSIRASQMKLFSAINTYQPINFDSLGFLLKKSDPNLILQLQVAERAYLSAFDSVKTRNDAYTKMQEKAQVCDFDQSQMETGEFTLGHSPLDVYMMGSITNLIFEAADRANHQINKAFIDLFKAAKKFYPGERLLATDKIALPPRRMVV